MTDTAVDHNNALAAELEQMHVGRPAPTLSQQRLDAAQRERGILDDARTRCEARIADLEVELSRERAELREITISLEAEHQKIHALRTAGVVDQA